MADRASDDYQEAEKRIATALREQRDVLDLTAGKTGRLTDLPESLRQLKKLRELYLLDNLLTALPTWLGQLTNLQSLNVSFNRLTAVPEGLGQLTQLKVLDLSDNQLTVLPDCLGELRQLQLLSTRNPLHGQQGFSWFQIYKPNRNVHLQ